MQVSLEEAELLLFLPGDALRTRLFALVEALFARLAAAQPTILVIEDMHWADPSTFELVDHLVALTGRAAFAIVGVFRDGDSAARLEASATRHGVERLAHVRLAPLPEQASLEMVQQVLATPSLPARLRRLILEKAEGNPFFVEEVIRSLIDRGALMLAESGRGWVATPLIERVDVPDTLHGILMSRLDRLPDETRWLAQQAAVIGRIFHEPVLRHLAERGDGLQGDLDQLRREELIRERARHPEVEYIFKHALTQEVAYSSLLAARRKALHRKVGEAIEAVFAGRLGELRSIVGEHFLKGEAWDRAVEHLVAGGDVAARLYAHAEARTHYADALAALAHLPDDLETRRRRIDVTLKLVAVSVLVEGPESTLARLAEAEALAGSLPNGEQAREDQLRVARVHYWIGRAHYYRNDLARAVERFQQVLESARDLGDDELLATPATLVGRVMLLRGRFGEARRLLAQAIPLLDKLGDWYEWTATVGFYGMALTACGEHHQGVEHGERALARALESGNPTAVALSHIFLAYSHHFAGDVPHMRHEALAALEAAERSGERLYLYLALAFRGWVESCQGDHAAAWASIDRAQAIYDSLGGQLLFADGFAAIRADVALNAGRLEEAAALAEEAVAVGRAFGGLLGEGIARRVWGQTLAALDPPRWTEAEVHLAAGLQACEIGDARLEAAWTHLAWGRLAHARGDPATAREHLEHAAAQFEASALPDALAQARAALATVQDGVMVETT